MVQDLDKKKAGTVTTNVLANLEYADTGLEDRIVSVSEFY